GAAGLHDRTSRPHRLRAHTPEGVQAQIEALRRERRPCWKIAAQKGVSRATAARICKRKGLARLSVLEPRPPVVRYEKETPGEMIHKGMWMGGNVPLGYDVKDRKLVVNETEAATVRLIFQRYAELGSVALLRAELERAGIVSKRREGAGGELRGGKRFSRGALYLMLQNRLYRGEVAHKVNIYPGQHEAIIESELWQTVQDRLAAGWHERSMAVGAESVGGPDL
ncbi:MAG: recombinase family protein, partial [Methyloceanibacter sp.]